MKRFLYTALLALVSVTMAWAGEDLTLWYDKPAAQWVEALPVGNGRLGAMVFGGTDRERIQLNEETVWTGHPNSNARPDALEAMPKIRELIFAGKYREAQDMVGRQLISNTNQCMSYQPVGDLNLNFPGHERFTDYRRELNISDAVAATRYTVDGVTYKREVFASFAHDVTVVRLTASKKGALSFTANLTSPLKTQVAAEDGALVMRGASGGKDNLPGGKLKFTTVLRAEADGEVTCTDGEMRVSGATAVTLYVSIGTNFVNYKDISGDADKRAFAALDAADGRKYAKLLKAHSETYQHYFNRVSLDLGTTPAMNLPTDKRVEQFATGDDPQLVSLYFQFGRYLLISCSQPGGQAANLQGIWNEHITPPWGSKYTTNINAEMNYWPAEVTHLAEMHEPFLRMVREVAQSGSETLVIGSHGTAIATVLNHFDPSFGYEGFESIRRLMPWIVRLDFEGDGGVFSYTNAQGFKQLPFGICYNKIVPFPQEGYSREVATHFAPGSFYKCASSAGWSEPNKFYISARIIDEYLGGFHFHFYFVDEDHVVFLSHGGGEAFGSEYHGYAEGFYEKDG